MREMRRREDIYNAIENLLVEHQLVKKSRISLSARITDDLGIAGDDADEFIDAVRQRFDIEFPLDNAQHFGAEAGFCNSPISDPMTVSMLVDLIKEALDQNFTK